jgi:predicted nucleotidyltransferase component of viral defense system
LKDRKPKNIAASVRQKLSNLSRETGEDFQLLLTRYAIERLLYRLSKSSHANRFVLKGAMLFALWTGKMHRPTRDLDLLSFGDNSEGVLRGVFRDLCAAETEDDGLLFDPDTVTVEPIREEQEYGGERVQILVRLGSARVNLQVDVGIGDAITPPAQIVAYPSLLGMPSPQLLAYPRETVVAEKLQAMVQLGMPNSRMKDFFDVFLLSRSFSFAGEPLRNAIKATFSRRRTAIPKDDPSALTDAFAKDETKTKQWSAFLRRSGLAAQTLKLEEVVAVLRQFLLPPLKAAAENKAFTLSWATGGPWEIAKKSP